MQVDAVRMTAITSVACLLWHHSALTSAKVIELVPEFKRTTQDEHGHDDTRNSEVAQQPCVHACLHARAQRSWTHPQTSLMSPQPARRRVLRSARPFCRLRTAADGWPRESLWILRSSHDCTLHSIVRSSQHRDSPFTRRMLESDQSDHRVRKLITMYDG